MQGQDKKGESTKKLVDAYIEFQRHAASPFHVVAHLQAQWQADGFHELSITSTWQLQKGSSYFVVHPDGKSIIAFTVGTHNPEAQGFAIIGAHTDSPSLRLRMNPWQEDDRCLRLLTQNHGGLIERSWFDRPLLLAGAVYNLERNKSGEVVFAKDTGLPRISSRLVASTRPLAVIPDLAIHLDRQKNQQGGINAEMMLAAIVGVKQPFAELRRLLPSALGMDAKATFDGFELTLAPYWEHTVVGLAEDFIVGPRHDDLAMVFCAARALGAARAQGASEKNVVAAFFDAEETGSRTSSGAAASFLRDVLTRLHRHHPARPEHGEVESALAKSFVISADMAHAYHPSFPDRFDVNHRLSINGGMVIKENADDRYATSGWSGTLFRGLCEAAEVPVQGYIHRQDLACGSTIGPTVAAALSCQTVDVGTAMWAMHSTAETMGTRDLGYAVKAFTAFYAGRAR